MRQVTRKGLMTVAAATGVIAAAGGTAAQAHSGASGSASHSPGVLSGNSVQAPVHAPVNACGNTVDVVGVLNPAVGNTCVNSGGAKHGTSGRHSGSGGAHAGGHTSHSPGVASGNHVEVPVYAPVNVCGNSVNVVGIGNGATGNDCGNGGGAHDRGTPNHPGGPDRPGHPGNLGNPDGGPGNSGNQPGDPNSPRDRANPDGPARPGTPGDPSRPGGEVTAHGGPSTDLHAGTGSSGSDSVTEARGGGVDQLAATGSELPLGIALPVGAGALLAGTVLYRKARASA
ncbi:chaplin family protein [Streptomyces sp. NPDC054829]